VAWVWLRERLTPWRIAGLAVGFAGVLLLAWGKVSFKPSGSGLAIVAALVATLSYGIAASYTKRRLTGVDPLAVATGSQVGAACHFPAYRSRPFSAYRSHVEGLSRHR
jgi:drug/metabolite transporter (DMT)-like permease